MCGGRASQPCSRVIIGAKKMNAPLDKSLIDTIKAPHFPIYMDYSATTPIDPRVADKMIPYLREQFGNPASRSHMYGLSLIHI